MLKPWGERKRTVFQVAPQVQQKLNRIPGIRAMVVSPPALPGGGQFPVEFVIASTGSHEELVAANGRYARLFTLQAQGYR